MPAAAMASGSRSRSARPSSSRPRSPPSARTPGPTSTTPTAGPPRWPRPPLPARQAVGWSSAALAWSAPRPPSGRTGATTPWSPTAPAPPSPWTPTIAATPWSSSPSATSSRELDSATAHQGCSAPMPPGRWWPPSRTTSCDGSPRSGSTPTVWWWPRRSAGASSPYPAGSPTPHGAATCTYRRAGRGLKASAPPGPPARAPAADLTPAAPSRPTPTPLPWLGEACPDNCRPPRDDHPQPRIRRNPSPTHTRRVTGHTHSASIHHRRSAAALTSTLGPCRGGFRLRVRDGREERARDAA
jgi:hypothetical protein